MQRAEFLTRCATVGMPYDVCIKALSYMDPVQFNGAMTAAGALNAGFVWSQTSEGSLFWSTWYNKLWKYERNLPVKKCLLPPLEINKHASSN